MSQHQELQRDDDRERRGRMLERDVSDLRHDVERRQRHEWRRNCQYDHHQGNLHAAVDEYRFSHRSTRAQ